MREYLCRCLACGKEQPVRCAEPYPRWGEVFRGACRFCGPKADLTRKLTKKARAELREQEREEALLKRISELCAARQMTVSPLFQSVVIRTPKAAWRFDPHQRRVTLFHENSYPFNRKTGAPATAHVQFRNRAMTVEEVIAYIARHDHCNPVIR